MGISRLICVSCLAGCTLSPPSDAEDADFGGTAGAITNAELTGVLWVANEATLEELDLDAELDARAARGIVGHRAGRDAVEGTSDDDHFDDLPELDAVPYVGEVALERLLAYARGRGLVDEGEDGEACLILSEYMEGQGNYNKAVELWNCGDAPIALDHFGVCMVRNDETTCTVTTMLAPVALEPGATWVTCRRDAGQWSDPYPFIVERCQQEMPGAMSFSGDDRLVVFQDVDRSSTFDPAIDRVTDALGRFGYRPPETTWADVDLRRCNLTPADGTAFYDDADYFTRHSRHDYVELGLPPMTSGCP